MRQGVAFVTGTRAEYGLLRPLMQEAAADAEVKVQVIVTGTHLSNEFGLTWHEIEKDGFSVDERVEILLSSDTDVAVCKAMGLALISFGEVYARLKPAIVVGLGDRFELLAAVAAASVCRHRVAHIHGGELTEGAFDDAFRHAITKMSHLHFTSTEVYRNRVVQLGESPDRVFNVGALGIDNIRTLDLLSRGDLERELDVRLDRRTLLVTFHPVTLEEGMAKSQFGELLAALNEMRDTQFVFTKANADPEGRTINAMIDDFVQRRADSARDFVSLGQLRYLSLMKYVNAVVGNSSSGLIEAPSLQVPTVNVGDRQRGRVRAASVIDCAPTRKAIEEALGRALSEEFRSSLKGLENPYGDGHSARRIWTLLKANLTCDVKKAFYDIPLTMMANR